MDELDTELDFHFTEAIDRLVERGWTTEDARAEVARRFGNRPRYQRQLASIDRAHQRGLAMRSFFSCDLRDALRFLRATPVLTTVTVLSLVLGIGASASLFSILDALVLQPLPVREPDRLALVDNDSWTNPIWEQIKQRQTQLVEDAFAWSNETFDLSDGGESRIVEGAYVSGEMFDTLGVNATTGRTIGTGDDVRGGGPEGVVAVISDALWRRWFGGARDVVGRHFTINRVPVTIVGVTPPHFHGPEVGRSADVYLALGAEAAIKGKASALDQRANWWLNIMVRLKPGQTVEAAALALNQVRPRIRAATVPPEWTTDMQARYLTEPFTVSPAASGRSTLRTRFAEPLTITMVVVGAVLLIACANIMNLMLARASGRRRDMSVRLALGASRWRLTRQLLIESLLISIAGGAAALLFARWSSALLLQQLGSATNTPTLDLSMDWRVLAFTGCIGLATTLLFGLAPAAGLSGVNPNDALRVGARGSVGGGSLIRNSLVVAQVALSLGLVIVGALFVRTFSSLVTTPLGFNATNLVIVSVDGQRVSPPSAGQPALFQRVVETATAVAGVHGASASFMTPLSTSGWNDRINLPDRPDLSPQQRTFFKNAITSGWFATYGMHILAGRDFAASDVAGRDNVAIVNDTFARRFLGSQSPVGQRVTVGGLDEAEHFVIVGVTNDAIYRSARRGVVPTMYLPMAQSAPTASSFSITVRAGTDGETVKRGLAEAFTHVDSGLTFSFRDYSDQIRASVSQERLIAMLSGFFGVLALLLAGLGLYGVTSHSVNRRRAEIAVRMALGARPGRVVRMVLGRVSLLVGIGIVAGLGLSLWLVTFVGALLFNLDQRDPLTFAGAALVLLIVGLFAGWLPAWRASRLNPTEALKG